MHSMKWTAVVLLLGCTVGALATDVSTQSCRSCIQGLQLATAPASLDLLCPPWDLDRRLACVSASAASLPARVAMAQQPGQTCTDMGLCTPQTLVALSGPDGLAEGTVCSLCEQIASDVKADLTEPSTQKAFFKMGHQACQQLVVDEAIEVCDQYVEEYGAQLFAALEATDVDSLCVEAGACPVAHRLPVLPPHLRAAVLNISSRAANDEDACNTCKLVVMEMAALLADPATAKEVLDYAKQACGSFGADFKDQCVAYIELYGPMVIQMAKQYLQPGLCVQLDFCPPPPPSVLSTARMSVTA